MVSRFEKSPLLTLKNAFRRDTFFIFAFLCVWNKKERNHKILNLENVLFTKNHFACFVIIKTVYMGFKYKKEYQYLRENLGNLVGLISRISVGNLNFLAIKC